MSRESEDQLYDADAYRALNAVCDEFRRRLKRRVLKLSDNVVTANSVYVAAKFVTDSSWLEEFQADEQKNKALDR